MLTIDFTEYAHLPARARYDAVGALIDQAKAAVAAERASIAAELVEAQGAQTAADTLGISAARVYKLAARHRATTATQTTEYGVWDTVVPGGVTLRDGLTQALADAEADVDAIEADYRAALGAALDPVGVTLAGEIFYGPYPRRDVTTADLAAIVEGVDLWEIVARHDSASG